MADLDKNGDGIVDYFSVLVSGYDAAASGVAADGMWASTSMPCWIRWHPGTSIDRRLLRPSVLELRESI
jgi:hypothetical protein